MFQANPTGTVMNPTEINSTGDTANCTASMSW